MAPEKQAEVIENSESQKQKQVLKTLEEMSGEELLDEANKTQKNFNDSAISMDKFIVAELGQLPVEGVGKIGQQARQEFRKNVGDISKKTAELEELGVNSENMSEEGVMKKADKLKQDLKKDMQGIEPKAFISFLKNLFKGFFKLFGMGVDDFYAPDNSKEENISTDKVSEDKDLGMGNDKEIQRQSLKAKLENFGDYTSYENETLSMKIYENEITEVEINGEGYGINLNYLPDSVIGEVKIVEEEGGYFLALGEKRIDLQVLTEQLSNNPKQQDYTLIEDFSLNFDLRLEKKEIKGPPEGVKFIDRGVNSENKANKIFYGERREDGKFSFEGLNGEEFIVDKSYNNKTLKIGDGIFLPEELINSLLIIEGKNYFISGSTVISINDYKKDDLLNIIKEIGVLSIYEKGKILGFISQNGNSDYTNLGIIDSRNILFAEQLLESFELLLEGKNYLIDKDNLIFFHGRIKIFGLTEIKSLSRTKDDIIKNKDKIKNTIINLLISNKLHY